MEGDPSARIEKGDDAGDNQGLEWFQVKKKNRSSSKLSVQKVPGISSYTYHAASPQNYESENSQYQRQKGSSESPEVPLLKPHKHAECIVSSVSNMENKPPGELLSFPAGVASDKVDTKSNLDEIPKSRCDFENKSVLSADCRNASKLVEIRCTITESDLLADGSSACYVPALDSSHHASTKNGMAVGAEDQLPHGKGLVIGDVEFLDANESKKNSPETMGANCGSDHSMLTNDGHIVAPDTFSSTVDSEQSFKGLPDVTMDTDRKFCENSGTTECEISNVTFKDREGLQQEEFVTENSICDSVDAPMENKNNFLIVSSSVADLEEGESVESKERFRQRLWCFLFENLNRAVDELYLLCELECDLEQMDEAVLVLEEAAFDFRELKYRVENFENTKKSSSPVSKDVAQINGKTDHRRPHALSWEVRRMTTSAQRAEILSSSLEAFKKIQLQRTAKTAAHGAEDFHSMDSASNNISDERIEFSPGASTAHSNIDDQVTKTVKQNRNCDAEVGKSSTNKQSTEANKPSKIHMVQNIRMNSKISASIATKLEREQLTPISEIEKMVTKDKLPNDNSLEKQAKSVDMVRRQSSVDDKEKEKDKRSIAPWKTMDAWKDKRNWADILKSPVRSTRVSHSPGIIRKGTERARVLHDKLMSPEKRKKKSALDMKREAEEKHARAMRIRSQLESERAQRLHRTTEKLNRVNEWQAVRSLKLREGMYARHQRNESRHEAYLAQVAKRAGDESIKVNEVRFITSLNEENKKLIYRQKLHDSEMRRAEKLLEIRMKQKEDVAREEAALERRKLIEAEKMQRLVETQRRKEEAQVRREEERKASSAAREARAVEQLRRKEIREKAQQEEQELLALKLAERLRESEQRRKFYLEQIREKASMDFRDQSSPLLRRSSNKGSIVNNGLEDFQAACISSARDSVNVTDQQTLKKKIKKIRQRLMALKYEFSEPAVENRIGFRASVGCARAKVGRWLQGMQRLRQDRKEGAASIGLIFGDMIKFLEGKEPELHASRQAGLLDFISSALPASHTSKPEACQVTLYLLRLLRAVLFLHANRSYFLAQNLLPPIIPMLSASLENYIKIAADSSPVSSIGLSCKNATENSEMITEVLDCFLWVVSSILGHAHVDDRHVDDRQIQMQDGLVELVVSYQVVHRLRDLFALYDRPQVEGAPFPASILSSLNLLAVLTSRPSLISRNWESFISRATFDKVQEANSEEKSLGSENPSIVDSMTDNSPSVVLSVGESCHLSGKELQSSSSDFQGRTPQHFLQIDEPSNSTVCLDNSVFVEQGCEIKDSDEAIHSLGEILGGKCLKDEKSFIDDGSERKGNEIMTSGNNRTRNELSSKPPMLLLFSAVAETGLVSLPSLLTAVLLNANNRVPSEQASYILPVNFEEAATGVLKVLNNLAAMDITFLQSMLMRTDLKMEFFHMMSFLLSHCTSKWNVSNDKVGLLMLETLLLLGYFALFHHENQEVLRWGKSPTILHKVCDLPFVFFSDPELTPILAGTLMAACYGCEQNRAVVLQELSLDMLLTLVKSCRQGLLPIQTDLPPPDGLLTSDLSEPGNQAVTDTRKPTQSDLSTRPNRKSIRVLSNKVVSGSSVRAGKARIQRDVRGSKTCEDWALKHNLPASGGSSSYMLHHRFPVTFLDKAESFFLVGK